MTQVQFPDVGKIDVDLFRAVIRPKLGSPDDSVLVGPKNGVDVGVIDLGGGQVMAVTTDPFFVVPAFGWQRAAWFAVHILASDVATSGLAPRYVSIDLNLPPEMTAADFELLWSAVHDSCKALGINVVTGHTGRYEGCAYPMIGGCTMMAVGDADRYVVSGMSRPDDVVVVTKGAGIEATALMAATFPDQVRDAVGAELARAADALFESMSTVRESRIAAGVGVRDAGVTAMHDATECGVFGGLVELAEAAGVAMEIDVAAIPVRPEVEAVCAHYDMDPYVAISEGSLLLTCRPTRVAAVLSALAEEGIDAAQIGRCGEGRGVTLQRQGRTVALAHPRVDPFWRAFAAAAAR